MTDAAAHPALVALATDLGERLVLPGDPRWDDVRMPWNLAIDQHPAAVVGARRPGRTAGGARRGTRRRTAARRAAERARGIRQPRRHRARAHGGLRRGRGRRRGPGRPHRRGGEWGRVLDALAGTGLVAMSGSSVVVNATAFTLGGGSSWFSRAHGLASSSLRAVELLTADGRHRWLRDADEPELLWASRGAGGAFGVVTAIEVDLHPAPRAHRWAPRLRADGCRGGVPRDHRRRSRRPRHARPARRRPAHPRRAAGARRAARARDFATAEFVELGASDEARAAIDRVRAAGTVITRHDRPDRRSSASATSPRSPPTPPPTSAGRRSRISTARPSTGSSSVAVARGAARHGALGSACSAERSPRRRHPPGHRGRRSRGARGERARALGAPGGEEAARRGFEALHAALGIARIRPHLLHLPRARGGLHRRVRRVRRGTRREREGHRRPRGPVPRQSRLLVTRRRRGARATVIR